MITGLLVLHLFVTLAMIGVVLIQRSEGGGLGIGATQGMGSFMSGRGTANLLTRGTAVLATLFMVLSLLLAVLNRGTAGVGRDILSLPRTAEHVSARHPDPLAGLPSVPADRGAASVPATPAPAPAPSGPAVPTTR